VNARANASETGLIMLTDRAAKHRYDIEGQSCTYDRLETSSSFTELDLYEVQPATACPL
jgi:hypothetical protein